ncbi:hypothetical protein [Streptomyces sp. NPDC059063]|uniref:hypothetical protein n=1 Tax=Streptomyces sp. NPDC059063 TaxID=3346712 RepID=UPI0036C9F61D
MTATGRIIIGVYALGAVAAVSAGGYFLGTGRYAHSMFAYLLATLFVSATRAELGHTGPRPGGQHDTGQPGTVTGPRPLIRLRARLQARRETRRTLCGCDLYWTTAGREHDDWCPGNDDDRNDIP